MHTIVVSLDDGQNKSTASIEGAVTIAVSSRQSVFPSYDDTMIEDDDALLKKGDDASAQTLS